MDVLKWLFGDEIPPWVGLAAGEYKYEHEEGEFEPITGWRWRLVERRGKALIMERLDAPPDVRFVAIADSGGYEVVLGHGETLEDARRMADLALT